MATPFEGKTVIVLGGSSGIGMETARQASALGAHVIITGRDEARLTAAVGELGPSVQGKAFDVTDRDALRTLFADLGRPVDHVMITSGTPYYAKLADVEPAAAAATFRGHVGVLIEVGQSVLGRISAGGSITIMSGTAARHPAVGLSLIGATAAGLSATAATLALELSPARVNVIAAGFVDTPLSARLLGGALDERRRELQQRLPARRIVTAADVAELAIHLMSNPAITGATFDIDGGQQLVPGL